MKKLLILLLLVASSLFGQASSSTAYRIRRGSSLPATCSVGDVFFKTSATVGMYQCAVTNTWSLVAGSSSGIGGTIAATEVPYGSAANTLSAMGGTAWNNTTRELTIANGSDVAMRVSSILNGELENYWLLGVNTNILSAPSQATSPGIAAAYIEMYAPGGGNTTIATTGVGGVGGSIYAQGGNGGVAASATTASTGGLGGGTETRSGNGGAAAATGGTNVGGAAGNNTLTAGSGGNATNGGSNTGGAGGDIFLRNGSGGTGATANGSDGTTLIQAGARANDAILKVQSNGGSTDFVRVLTGGSFATFKGANVASTATMTLTGGNVFHITGTDNITTLNTCDATNAGRQVTLIFDGVLTFTDGNNLKLAGNFVTTADDSITVVCDGTNWYEMSRSIN